MKQIKTSAAIALLAIAPASLLADNHDEKTPTEPTVEETVTKEEAKEEKFDVEFVVVSNDAMQFDVKAIEVEAGQTVKLTLKNVGQAPKAAMGHNLVILNKEANLMSWANKAMTARETEFIPVEPEGESSVLAHTKLLGPNEEDTIFFTIGEAGEYAYLCSFPGHFALMQGKITVK